MVSNVQESKVKRIEWLDIAKGINILLVIIGHTACAKYKTIYSFHMALFAVLTGITIHNSDDYRDILKYIWKDFLHLFLPFAICLLLDDFLKVVVWKTEETVDLTVYCRKLVCNP